MNINEYAKMDATTFNHYDITSRILGRMSDETRSAWWYCMAFKWNELNMIKWGFTS